MGHKHRSRLGCLCTFDSSKIEFLFCDALNSSFWLVTTASNACPGRMCRFLAAQRRLSRPMPGRADLVMHCTRYFKSCKIFQSAHLCELSFPSFLTAGLAASGCTDYSNSVPVHSIQQGSALAALKGEQSPVGAESVRRLMEAVDSSIPAPQRPIDLPFAMPIEDVFNIQVGRSSPYLTPAVSFQWSSEGPERQVLSCGPQVQVLQNAHRVDARFFPQG
jgi:hypothetical protein